MPCFHLSNSGLINRVSLDNWAGIATVSMTVKSAKEILHALTAMFQSGNTDQWEFFKTKESTAHQVNLPSSRSSSKLTFIQLIIYSLQEVWRLHLSLFLLLYQN